MEAFSLVPPQWTQSATHALEFCCPNCRAPSIEAQRVWVNRRSPVITEDHSKKWQEFYDCHCGTVWWAWNSDRPPSELAKRQRPL
ncbi:MAG: hypothetical protein F6J86_17460 [Symploca sp. SIO1B1]|nr:hypothetical protein [Symploca sp. SIO2D2]NER24373.1 hypothetical protein [Symploca sp. SIO1C2]NER47077.1 hypothetical protein [Symploca sp. SIO1A3]NER95600.1 hypothetical protein [Symploca sp. SIO1B1]